MHTQSKYRLLVVRLGAMGDILHALPAVTALRQAHPDWTIDWVVEPRWRALLSALDVADPNPVRCVAQPLVDQLYHARTRDWRQRPLSDQTRSEIKSLRAALRDADYDVVLDLQGAIRSAVVARFANSRRLIGESNPRERIARFLFTERVATTQAHVIDQDVELASAIAGDDLIPAYPSLPLDRAAEAWAETTLPPSRSQPSVLINPGAGWGAKRWPIERFATVAQALIQKGLRVLVNTGPGEEFLAQTLSQQTNGAIFPLSCTVAQLIAVTRRISLCIAGDTGPLHLACALGRSVVGIYGPTDPSRNGPYGTRFKVLRSSQSRRDHTRHAAPEAGLLTIQPDDVLNAAAELLAGEAP